MEIFRRFTAYCISYEIHVLSPLSPPRESLTLFLSPFVHVYRYFLTEQNFNIMLTLCFEIRTFMKNCIHDKFASVIYKHLTALSYRQSQMDGKAHFKIKRYLLYGLKITKELVHHLFPGFAASAVRLFSFPSMN